MFGCMLCFIQLQKDLEEVKELLKKASRKRLHDMLLAEKNKIEKEIKSKPLPKLKPETSEEDKTLPTGYTIKINNYGRTVHILYCSIIQGIM